MKRKDFSVAGGWRMILVAVALLLAGGPAMVRAEPTVADVAKDVAALAARVQDRERF
jgi:hypothetical protein